MSESIDCRLCGPVYGIAQREAVEWVGETAAVADPGFLLKMDIVADSRNTLALLLYTRREYALRFIRPFRK